MIDKAALDEAVRRFPNLVDTCAKRTNTGRRIYLLRNNWESQGGRRNEPFAVAQLELIREIETRKIGFITTNDGRFGASPNRVVMSGDAVAITLEFKCPTPPVHMEYLLAEHLAAMVPASRLAEEYRCQRQGRLFISEADEAIFYSYHPQMPACYARDHRDEPFIRKLDAALEQFSDELEALMYRAKSLGAYQIVEEMRAPAETEYADNIRYEPMGDDEMDTILRMAVAGTDPLVTDGVASF